MREVTSQTAPPRTSTQKASIPSPIAAMGSQNLPLILEPLPQPQVPALRPEDGGNSEAGKAIFRQITAAARAKMERVKQAKDTRQTVRQGANHDNR